MNCKDCIFWDNSDDETSWNEQYQQNLDHPYTEYGTYNSKEMLSDVFRGVPYFGNFTHKDFCCIHFKK